MTIDSDTLRKLELMFGTIQKLSEIVQIHLERIKSLEQRVDTLEARSRPHTIQ